MPTYKYRCEECGEVIKISHKMNEEKTPGKCNKCGSAKLSRIFSLGGISVKGTSSCPDGTCPWSN
ncbi:MAG: zinc ribbon domain-containing protein [Candidatus Aerophobetes bacterium]|nr:zinc ribbon domain-containing protein [Candidatus Aerophobetes bacterium]